MCVALGERTRERKSVCAAVAQIAAWWKTNLCGAVAVGAWAKILRIRSRVMHMQNFDACTLIETFRTIEGYLLNIQTFFIDRYRIFSNLKCAQGKKYLH